MTFLTLNPDSATRLTILYDIIRSGATRRSVKKGEDAVMFYVIGWVAVGAYAGRVAGAKGRNPVRWLLLGAFFGPLATMAACFMPPALAAQKANPAPARRICPHCSNELSPTARMCRWCKRLV